MPSRITLGRGGGGGRATFLQSTQKAKLPWSISPVLQRGSSRGAQPPAQRDGRPPVGHGARVTSRGRGTSFANPLGFGKLRALPKLGAASPWCSRTPPSACLPQLQLGQGTAPGASCAGFFGRASPRGGFPTFTFPSPPAALTATSCARAEPAPWHRPAQNPREKQPAHGDPPSPPPGCSPQGSNPAQSRPAGAQPCRELRPARSHRGNCLGRAQVRLPPLPGFGSI